MQQEYLNQDVKTNVIGKSVLSIKLKCANVEGFMNERKSNKKQVQKYFHADHVRYAA
ncbi:MAG: hypothetical protein IPH58_10865 [Sphingobacteriales bacterium]|nr:hypothetical protein [Sphingobacteriales bacterium]